MTLKKLAYFRRENSNVFSFFHEKNAKVSIFSNKIQSETFFDDFEPILSLKKLFLKIGKKLGIQKSSIKIILDVKIQIFS